VLRYGNARELCLGLEVVTASGDIWDGLTGLRKDNTGYDLRDLFVGSEGTLGIITAATLKLHPRPQARVTALAACESVDRAVELLGRSRAHLDAGLTGFELMSAFAMTLVGLHFPQIPQPLQDSPWYVLMEAVGHDETFVRERLEHVLEQSLEGKIITNAVVAESMSQSKALWHLRESIPLAQAEEGLNIKHDISLPTSAIPAFVAQTDVELQKLVPGARLVNFGHLGDGNLHYNVQCPENTDAKAFLADHELEVNALVFDSVRAFGGSISAEHGIGELKRDCLPEYKSAVALNLMRTIKQALDPRGLLNPRRVVDASNTH
jgi:FAD/FMN-containing dehydrogenase